MYQYSVFSKRALHGVKGSAVGSGVWREQRKDTTGGVWSRMYEGPFSDTCTLSLRCSCGSLGKVKSTHLASLPDRRYFSTVGKALQSCCNQNNQRQHTKFKKAMRYPSPVTKFERIKEDARLGFPGGVFSFRATGTHNATRSPQAPGVKNSENQGRMYCIPRFPPLQRGICVHKGIPNPLLKPGDRLPTPLAQSLTLKRHVQIPLR